MLRRCPIPLVLACTILATGSHAVYAQAAKPQVQPAVPGPNAPPPAAPPPAAAEVPAPGHGILHLSATASADPVPLHGGLQWRVFATAAAVDGSHKVVAQSAEAQPAFDLPDGHYIVHATFGYASAMKQVVIADKVTSERMNLNAGAIEVDGTLGESAIPANRLSIAIYVPEHNNPEAKLVVAHGRAGEIICLPEGSYHIVSTYLDTEGVGSLTPVTGSNSTVAADLKIQAGKVLMASVKHKAAMLTLKLVNQPGGEALANTNFTILTPGGDVIRELIGAFPSLVLAEGDYVAIARHDGKTFQSEFKVVSAVDRDVEVMAH